jgi:hypothetical protein
MRASSFLNQTTSNFVLMSRKKNWREYLVAHATGWLDIATHYRILKQTIEILLVYIQRVQEKKCWFYMQLDLRLSTGITNIYLINLHLYDLTHQTKQC